MGKKMNWSEEVEDLVDAGDSDAAISLLESLISEKHNHSHNHNHNHSSDDTQSSDCGGGGGGDGELVAALLELSKLYSSKGLSLKSDQALSRASAISLRSPSSSQSYSKQDHSTTNDLLQTNDDSAIHVAGSSNLTAEASAESVAPQGSSDDDWEAIADRAPDELLSPQCLPEVSQLSLHDTEVKKIPNRRGRGTFTYKKQEYYNDELLNDSISCDASNDVIPVKSENTSEARNLYGTRHVLVLDGFNPSTTTTDLEKLFEDFRDRGFAIRWVNDTLALAVFRTPSIAIEAYNSIRCSFKVRVLQEDDSIMSYISVNDLEPPRQRPKTSARTAQRLIAQELGVKLPSNFGSRELKKQENDRRNRIISRQMLKDEAWGPDS